MRPTRTRPRPTRPRRGRDVEAEHPEADGKKVRKEIPERDPSTTGEAEGYRETEPPR